MRNLSGTFIDVWTKEHDAAIARAATLAILKRLESIDKSTTDFADFDVRVMNLIGEIRKEQEQP